MSHLMPLLRLAQNHVGVQVELLLPVRTFLRLSDDLLPQLLHFIRRSCLGTELDTLHLGYFRIGWQHLVLRDQRLLLLTLDRVLRLCLLHDQSSIRFAALLFVLVGIFVNPWANSFRSIGYSNLFMATEG